MSPRRALMLVIEASLQEQPEEWSAGQFYLINSRRNMAIWIANSASGLEVKFEGAGVTIPFGWKRRLRRAVDVCIGKQMIDRFRASATEQEK